MLIERLLRPWLARTERGAADAAPIGRSQPCASQSSSPTPGQGHRRTPPLKTAVETGASAAAAVKGPLWTQAEVNAHLDRLRHEEERLLTSVQAVEQELSAVLSEYAVARAGSSPEVKRRLQRRFQRLTLRRSSLDQLHAEQLQLYRLLDHVEADLLRRDLAGSNDHDAVLGVPLTRLRETLELSVARSGHRHDQLRDTVEGLDVHQRDLALADHLGLDEVQAQMDALTDAEFRHAQANGLAEAEAWAYANGPTGSLPATAPVAACDGPPVSHWPSPPQAGPTRTPDRNSPAASGKREV